MTPEIALLLAQDGISTGAIYVLVALGLVLIFLVTRVIFVPSFRMRESACEGVSTKNRLYGIGYSAPPHGAALDSPAAL